MPTTTASLATRAVVRLFFRRRRSLLSRLEQVNKSTTEQTTSRRIAVKLPWVFLGLLAIVLISCGGVGTPTPPPRTNFPPPDQGGPVVPPAINQDQKPKVVRAAVRDIHGV